ncbi:aquaporin-like protein [Dothistroma septosporum NZE10]|uniref:Aquaporin-like protein n=1 Tax=Dothistroma septosporum (strain NZE10 / CBS 128990) TaxID=675120 RepID=M2Y2G4_DOTSN|nr:aquaporin-like protein [Dothistroma septosporum NZE10]
MRNHLVAPPGEFVGTFLFLFFAFLGYSVSVTSAPNYAADGSNSNQTVIYTSLSYGLPLLVTAWDLFRISGGLSNPAVTPGLVVTGQLPRIRGVIFFPVQLLGGVCAAAVASAIIPGDIAVTQTTLGNGVSVMQGLFLEVLFTSLLVLTILMLAVNKSKATFIIPIGIGMALFVTQISGVCYIGNSLNTARSFGPCVATAKFQGYHCIYWVGPFLGAFFSGGYWHFVKFFNYEEANPS